MSAEVTTVSKPSFAEAFRFWLKLGFISFGGPAGQIAIMHQFLVDKKRWISDSRFMHGLNYCMILPGPEAQQLATYIGWLLHGVRGGIAAGALFVLPSVFILLALSLVYVTFGKIEWVSSLFYGLKPAVIAIVMVALFKIAQKSLLGPFHYMVAMSSFIAIFFFNVSFPLIILISIVVGWFVQKTNPASLRQKRESESSVANESAYYLNAHTTPVTYGTNFASVSKKLIAGIVLWALPVLLFLMFTSDSSFWITLITFFSKAALVTFGGAYAVLPYVAQESVENFGWLSQLQMVDGLALGETTPGPLIMVLTFVGFMAGYHHGNFSMLDGTLGLITTAYYTFLPSFIFIFVGAPFVERTKENRSLKLIFSITTAAVVGVILSLTIYLGKAVLFPSDLREPDWFALVWATVSFVALFRFKVTMILWIAISAGAGLVLHLF